jgi:hypothetical protein
MRPSQRLPLLLVVILTACASGKREASSLVAAVDRYRRAEMEAKVPLVEAIAAVPCTVAEVCGAQKACLAAARPTARGVALKFEVEESLAELRAGKITQAEAGARGLPQKLDEAGRLLDEGHAKIPECDAKTTALRLKYGL